MFSKKKRATFRSLPQILLIASTAILGVRLAAPLLSSVCTGRPTGIPALSFDLSQPAEAALSQRFERIIADTKPPCATVATGAKITNHLMNDRNQGWHR